MITDTRMQFLTYCVCLFILCVINISFASAFDIVDDYKLNLSSSGPALSGSFIKFDAKLFEGTSQSPQDKSLFKYEWKSDVDRITEEQHADFNTTYKRCFENVIARNYTMTVAVYALKYSLFKPIVKNSLNFSITDSLNGNLDHKQSIHRRKGAHKNIFSTQKPINFLVNISDEFSQQPTLTYKWMLDGKLVDANNYNNRTLSLLKPGTHTVTVNVSSSWYVDCRGLPSTDLNGLFQSKLVLKDPVLELTLFGRRDIEQGQNVTLQAVFNGSAPYTVCWELLSQTERVIVNQTCVNVTEAPITDIHVPSEYLTEIGMYTLNMSVENDVSVYHSHQRIVVNAVPTTTMSPDARSATHILIPVICALIATTLMLFAGVYIINRRNKQQHIESANFDFHSSIRQKGRGSIFTDIKDTVRGLLQDANGNQPRYGSLDNPAA